jgi:L-threonylcarbamoyladenylate synthase
MRGEGDAVVDIVKVDPRAPDPALIRESARLLQRGAVIGYPTETFYGLGADARNRAARERIFAVKGRQRDKALSVIVSDADRLAFLCEKVPPPVAVLAARFWPGPLTLVVPLRRELRVSFGGGDSVAVRVSGLPLARELARAAGCCLTATSANRSGEPPADNARELSKTLGSELDLILDGGPTPGDRPSTIVDVTGGEPRLVRDGPVAFDDVLQTLRDGAVP